MRLPHREPDAGSLMLAGRTVLLAASRRSGTSASQFPDTPGEIGGRFTGTSISRLSPAQLKGRGTLHFTDPTGKAFNLPVNLARDRENQDRQNDRS
jgi:hypothetical protein